MSGDGTLFKGTFIVDRIDAQKYDRAARLYLNSTTPSDGMTVELDINNELFPVTADDNLVIGLASTLALDGSKDDTKSWRDISRGASSLADMYDYVCHGKVYRFEETSNAANLQVFISFGGLLMMLDGDAKILTKLRIDYVYLLVRRA